MATETTTLRVPVHLRDEIAALAEKRGTTMLDVVIDAIRQLRREQWWTGVHAAIESLDSESLDSHGAETTQLDQAAGDGIE